MVVEEFNGRAIRIIEYDDANGERVLEFVDPASKKTGAAMAVYSTSEDWQEAQVSISPRVESISVEFMVWALEVARRLMGPN
jgi:hypothetical protein